DSTVTADPGRKRNREASHAAIEQELLMLAADRNRSGIRRPCGVIATRTALDWQSWGGVRLNSDVLPLDGAGQTPHRRVDPVQVRFQLTHRTGNPTFVDFIFSVRIRFRDEPLGEFDPHAGIQLTRAVEVHHRRFHAHGALQLELEASISEVVDESGKVTLAAKGIPIDGEAVFPRYGRERPP